MITNTCKRIFVWHLGKVCFNHLSTAHLLNVYNCLFFVFNLFSILILNWHVFIVEAIFSSYDFAVFNSLSSHFCPLGSFEVNNSLQHDSIVKFQIHVCQRVVHFYFLSKPWELLLEKIVKLYYKSLEKISIYWKSFKAD